MIKSEPICITCWIAAKGHWENIFQGKELLVCQMPVRTKYLYRRIQICVICNEETPDGLIAPVETIATGCCKAIV